MKHRIIHIEDYEKYIGSEDIERIIKKAKYLQDFNVVNFNSTYYGGGVAEILSSLTLLMNSLGIKTEWRVIQGTPDFFSITKKMHNALQGGKINLSHIKKEIFEEVIFENSYRNHIDHDIVIIHDPQPLPMISFYKKKSPWIWRCHIDLSNPHKAIWNYLEPYIEKYDAVVLSCKEYSKRLKVPQFFFMPAINPFNIKNKELSESEMNDRLSHYKIPTDLPLVVQVSRFDRWKDPEGVIKAFKIARKEVDATLVLLGNFATDDPEGSEVYESIMASRDERILVLPYGDDTALVNTLQRKAAVVLQKSNREGFGLTVAEAMWKGTPVIGGNVGGIKYQIKDGVNGYLVSSIEEAADRIIKLIKDKKLRKKMGKKAKQGVSKNFLLNRYLEQYIDLFSSFEPVFKLKKYK